jgi:phosphoglycerate kinase
VVGGAKISTKLDVLTHLISRVDHLILGGGMANTFLAAQGYDMAGSLMEADLVDTAKNILKSASEKGCAIHLPKDGQAAREFKKGADARIIANEALAKDEMMLDIGPEAVASYSAVIREAKTVLWNGPMGAFEIPPFDAGTNGLARYVADCTADGLVSIAGGGDTVAALNHAGCADRFSYISLAGGAFLEWIEGRELPGIAILDSAP